MPPRELVPDSTVLIQILRRARIRSAARHLRRLGSFWLSSVVLAELHARTRSPGDRLTLTTVAAPVVRAGRVITPSDGDWVRAGQLIARRSRLEGEVRSRDHLNDVLILLSASRQGLAVATANVAHFRAWARDASVGGLTVEVVRFSLDA